MAAKDKDRMAGLRVESFTVPGTAGEKDERSAQFVRALDYGFAEPVRTAEQEVTQLDRFRSESTLLTAVYDDEQDPRALAAERPVATFGDYVGSVGLVPGVVLPAQMVTEVTVRGTHRRRGILTSVMTGALRRAQDQGLPLSLLTASEGGIYGRFGFGVAAYSNAVRVKVERGLHIRPEVRRALEDSGLRTFVPSWEAFPALFEDAFAAFQEATPGQTNHTQAYRQRAAGVSNPWAIPGADHDWRPLVVVDAAGAVRGYAITFAKEIDDHPTLVVADLGAADRLAELALWEALAATDLITRLRWRQAPLDFFLPAALVDVRDVDVISREDHLWARVLDVAAVFSQRGLAEDGELVLRVSDRLGLIDGDYLIRREGGETVVGRGEKAGVPLVELDAESLGTVAFCAARVADLAAVGRLGVASSDVAEVAQLLELPFAARNSYTF